MSKISKFLNIKHLLGDTSTTIYRIKDEYGEISVVDRQDLRLLMFNSLYVQSTMDLKKPYWLVHDYTRVMMLVLAFIKPAHVTMLGLGGGCLLRSFCHSFPTCDVHAIELRQQVYEVAREFFSLPTGRHINVTISDGQLALLQIADASTDIIFADMYQDYGMHPIQIQRDFISQCARVLDNQGWLVINYHQLPDLDSGFFKWLRRLFLEIIVCSTVSGNYILFAGKSAMEELSHFQLAVVELEKILDIELVYLFNRMIKFKR